MASMNMNEDIMRIDLESIRLKAGDTYPEEIPIIRQRDKVICTLGNLSVVLGLQKSRKTFLSQIFAAVYFGADICGLSSDHEGKILWIDTEMAKSDCAKVYQRIYRTLGWNKFQDHPELAFFSLREYSPEERLSILWKALPNYMPSFIVLDGVADLIDNTNDITESHALVTYLMKVSTEYNAHILCVLHLNPDAGKGRGHLGSELARKAETTMVVTKTDNYSTVTPKDCRHKDFEQFSFTIDDSDIPVGCETAHTPQDSNECLFQVVFSSVDALSYGDLKKAIMQILDCKTRTAETRIKKGKLAGIITQEANGCYHLRYTDETTILDDLPE